MDPSSNSEGPVEHKERRKIQFAVQATEPTQLDPRQVEMIRRRRPTPATLFRVADQTSPEDDISTHQWVVGENGVLKPKRINPNIYQPPSLKAVQQMAEAQMQKLGVYPHVEEEGEEPLQREGEELSSSCIPDSQEQRGMAEHQPGIRKTGTTTPTDEEEEEEEVDDMAEDECRNMD
ncbi:protein phosphatase 1 regulatory subunit 1B-like [Carassius auratus]|uniref:Protein phosphatase 1 regulatory subunit 1B n=1 Tax=Carassius auratus TaxID=7957 RepID=A0A6P6LU84_CARAU|nr:protein phosphatase 1 regulatory subunit 1B-like [Carassius auratus]XP_052389365.1 protein phosphatase 1 regulatory subunit 1B [Carassius gibelio]